MTLRSTLTRRAAVAAAAAALLAGCGIGEGAEATPPSPATTSTAPASSGPPQGQTLWSLLDDVGATRAKLREDDADVVAIRSLVIRHSDVVDNRTAAHIDASIEAEMRAYTEEFSASLAQQGFPDAVRAMYGDNDLAISLSSLAWYPSTISAGRRTATVQTASTFVFTDGRPTYLRSRKLATGTRYTEQRRISLIRTAQGWRISAIERLPLVQS